MNRTRKTAFRFAGSSAIDAIAGDVDYVVDMYGEVVQMLRNAGIQGNQKRISAYSDQRLLWASFRS